AASPISRAAWMAIEIRQAIMAATPSAPRIARMMCMASPPRPPREIVPRARVGGHADVAGVRKEPCAHGDGLRKSARRPPPCAQGLAAPAGGRRPMSDAEHANAERKLFPVPPDVAARAHVDAARYEAMYAASIADPEGFWGEQGKRLDWIRPYRGV